jgi:hypothetical protein
MRERAMPNERDPRPWDAFEDAEPGELSDPLNPLDPRAARDPDEAADPDQARGQAGQASDGHWGSGSSGEIDSQLEDESDAFDVFDADDDDDDEDDEDDDQDSDDAAGSAFPARGDAGGDDAADDDEDDDVHEDEQDGEAQGAGGGPGIDPSNLLLIVVGAHLRAEVADRPLAYRLQAAVHRWVTGHASELGADAFLPVVCSDIWYVNHPSLQRRPTISVGGPGVNALSAYFTDKLNAASVEENRYLIQLDPEFVDLRASIWGMNHELTVQALDTFLQRYLDGFLRAVGTQVEPKHD